MKRIARLVVIEDTGSPTRPRTRGDCERGPRPCPWFSCRHHLGVDISQAGRLSIPGGATLPDVAKVRELETFADAVIARVVEMGSCALDVAAAGEHTLDAVGKVAGVTRERARQIESRGKRLMRRAVERRLGLKAGEPLGFDPETGFDR